VIGEPDAGNPHVRFDEGRQETCVRAARLSPTLRKPRLSRSQLEKVDAALRQGARQHGFEAELWTLPRVAKLIERVTGERFHPGHVWKILGALDWSVQKPAQQARERSQQKVEYWVSQRWPEVKKTLASRKPGSTSKTNPGSHSNLRSEPRGRREGKPRS
jgi:transposase